MPSVPERCYGYLQVPHGDVELLEGEKSEVRGKMMAVFNSLEAHVVPDKLGLFCGPHRAEPQPMGLEVAGKESWSQ